MAAEKNLNRAILPSEMGRLIQELFPTMTRSDYVSVVGSEPTTRHELNATLDVKLTRDMIRRLKADPIRIYPNEQTLSTYFGFGYKPKTMRELSWVLKTIPELTARNTSWLQMVGEMGETREKMDPVHKQLFEKMGAPERLERMLGNSNALVNEAKLEQFYEGGPVVEGEGKVYPYPNQYTIRLPRGRGRKSRRSTRRKNRKTRRN